VIITTERKLIQNHVSRTTNAYGKAGLIVGFPNMFMGLFITAMGMKWFPVEPSKVHVPFWILTAIGSCFACAGMLLISFSLRDLSRQARTRRFKRLNPHEPWVWDKWWNTTKATYNPYRKSANGVFFTVFLAAFMTPFNWMMLNPAVAAKGKGSVWVLYLVAPVFDLICVGMAISSVLWLLRGIKHGKSSVQFFRFPFFVGEKFQAHLVSRKSIGHFDQLRITLRYVELQHDTWKNREVILPYQTYSATRILNKVQFRGRLAIEFDIPSDISPTSLSGSEPKYWELEVTGRRPGLDFYGLYLIPVYARAQIRKATA
jgi:hypothetical protein